MHGWLLQNGDTALHLAMSNGMVRIVQVIATKYHETIDVNAQNNVRGVSRHALALRLLLPDRLFLFLCSVCRR